MAKKKSKSNKKNSFIEKGLNFCNATALFTNLIFFVICLVYILWFFYFNKKYTKIDAKILSVNDLSDEEKCIKKKKLTRIERKTTGREKSYCNIEVEFTINGDKQNATIKTNDYSNKYSEGKPLTVFYNKEDTTDVILSKRHLMFKILYYISLVILISIAIMSYLRVYHKDNTLVKWWIGIECLDTFIPDFD